MDDSNQSASTKTPKLGAYAKLPVALIFAWILSAVVGVGANAVINIFFDRHSLSELSLPFAVSTAAAAIILFGSGAFVLGTLTTRINKWLLTVLYAGPMFILQMLSIFGITDAPIAEQMQKNSREVMQLVCVVLNPLVSYISIQKGRDSEFAEEPKKVLGIAWQHWIWITPIALYQTVSVPLFLLLLLWKIDFIIGEPSVFALPSMLLRIVVFLFLSAVLTAIVVAWTALSQTKGTLILRILKVFGVWLLLSILELFVLASCATKNANDMIEHHTGALKHLDEVIALDPNNSMSYVRKGREYAWSECVPSEKELPKAIIEYTKAISLDPKNTAAYIARGQVFKSAEKLPEAFSDFTKAISLSPQDPTAYVERADVLKDQKKKELAEADYDKAIALEPQNAEGFYERATAFYHQKELTKSLADLKSAISLDSHDARFFILRALCHQGLGDTKKAVADGVIAAGCVPKEEQVFREQGIEAYQEKAYERAILYLTHAIALEPKKAESYLYRAKSYEGAGNQIAASKDFDKAAALDKK